MDHRRRFIQKAFIAANIADSRSHPTLPTPRGYLWKCIKSYYHLPDPVKYNENTSIVILPPKWKVIKSHIIDHLGLVIANISPQKVCFDKKRLVDLKIILDVKPQEMIRIEELI